MISLRKSMDRLEECERQLDAVLECYAAALLSVETNVVAVEKDLADRHRQQLRQLRRKVKENPSLEGVNECRLALDRELESYCGSVTDVIRQRDAEVKKIVAILASAAAALASHSEVHNRKPLNFAKRLEAISKMDNLSDIRERLSVEVTQLKCFVEMVKRENKASVELLRAELQTCQRRLERAEALASTDSLTGVANRMEGERTLEEQIRSNGRFSVLILDLDDFKRVNDRHGHHAGDLLLRAFARRLRSSVRSRDLVCRWGGDEFLVILPDCDLAGAMERAKNLSDRCGREYALALDGRAITIPIRAAIGAVEHRSGETSEELLRRADAFLYRDKQTGLLACG